MDKDIILTGFIGVSTLLLAMWFRYSRAELLIISSVFFMWMYGYYKNPEHIFIYEETGQALIEYPWWVYLIGGILGLFVFAVTIKSYVSTGIT